MDNYCASTNRNARNGSGRKLMSRRDRGCGHGSLESCSYGVKSLQTTSVYRCPNFPNWGVRYFGDDAGAGGAVSIRAGSLCYPRCSKSRVTNCKCSQFPNCPSRYLRYQVSTGTVRVVWIWSVEVILCFFFRNNDFVAIFYMGMMMSSNTEYWNYYNKTRDLPLKNNTSK